MPPDVPGGELAISSNEIFDLARFPRRLVVVGGGYIACEFASIFNGLGTEVTQLYRGDQLLRGFDDDVRHFIAAEMQKKGVDVRLHVNVNALRRDAGVIRVTLADGGELDADAVLYATGRAPNTAGLGLEAIGVELAPGGAVVVDDRYRTNVDGVYAIGDVIDRVQLTPVALAEAMALVDDLFGDSGRRVDYRHIPTAVFTHPNIGTIGLTEGEARARFERVRIYRSEFKALRHTLSGNTERTLMKLVVDDASDRVVGLHMVGADAGETIQGLRGGDEGRRDQGRVRFDPRHSPDCRRGVRDDAPARDGMMCTTVIATRIAMPIDAFSPVCRAGISMILLCVAGVGFAADKNAAARSPADRLLTPAQARDCIARGEKLQAQKDDVLKVKSEADVMRGQLEQGGVDLKSEVTTLDRTAPAPSLRTTRRSMHATSRSTRLTRRPLPITSRSPICRPRRMRKTRTAPTAVTMKTS